MSLLDIVRAAVPAVAAARVGELRGEHAADEETRKEQLTANALARQSRLDQIKAQMDAAQQDRDNAQASYYRSRAANPAAPAAPHTLSTDDGIMQWDPVSKTFKPTGFRPPERASDRAAARADAREARQATKDQVQSTKDALSGVHQQITDTQRDLHEETGTYGDNDQTRIGQIRQRLDSLGGVSDSLNSVLKGGTPSPVKKAITSDQATYLKSARGMTDAQIQARYRVMP